MLTYGAGPLLVYMQLGVMSLVYLNGPECLVTLYAVPVLRIGLVAFDIARYRLSWFHRAFPDVFLEGIVVPEL